jgi:hypothetical protein
MLGNTQVSQRHQWKGFYDTACTGSTELLNKTACEAIQAQASRCESLLALCNKVNYDQVVCAGVLEYCRERSVYLVNDAGLNPYDFRKPCGQVPGCYMNAVYAQEYMNSSRVKAGLGVSPDRFFRLEDEDVFEQFLISGDIGKESVPEVVYLLNKVSHSIHVCLLLKSYHRKFIHSSTLATRTGTAIQLVPAIGSMLCHGMEWQVFGLSQSDPGSFAIGKQACINVGPISGSSRSMMPDTWHQWIRAQKCWI